MLILSCIKSIFNTDKANQELYRENYFSEEFLMDALQGVGFQSVEILEPTEEGTTSLNAELCDEKGNSFKIKIRHIGNMLSFLAHANRISITKTFQKKYIETSEESEKIFGNEAQTNLLWKCKYKANLFFEELKDEFKRRNKFI